MLDIIELNSKSQDDLVAIAKELKIRKPESLSKEDLVYAILDEQAIQSNESPAAAKKQQRKSSRKKAAAQEKAANSEAAPAPAEAPAAEAPAPTQEKRKRGRPRKNPLPETPEADATEAAAAPAEPAAKVQDNAASGQPFDQFLLCRRSGQIVLIRGHHKSTGKAPVDIGQRVFKNKKYYMKR